MVEKRVERNNMGGANGLIFYVWGNFAFGFVQGNYGFSLNLISMGAVDFSGTLVFLTWSVSIGDVNLYDVYSGFNGISSSLLNF